MKYFRAHCAGINLRENALTERGMSIILDGCLQVNNTLSVVSVEEATNSCGETNFCRLAEAASFISFTVLFMKASLQKNQKISR